MSKTEMSKKHLHLHSTPSQLNAYKAGPATIWPINNEILAGVIVGLASVIKRNLKLKKKKVAVDQYWTQRRIWVSWTLDKTRERKKIKIHAHSPVINIILKWRTVITAKHWHYPSRLDCLSTLVVDVGEFGKDSGEL